jgi:hypothetical protein
MRAHQRLEVLLLGGGRPAETRQPGGPLLHGGAPFQLPTLDRVQGPLEPDGVLTLHPVARVEQSLGPGTVIGQEQQTLRIAVQPPDRIDALAPRPQGSGHELEDRPLGVSVRHRARHAGRLVECQVDPR